MTQGHRTGPYSVSLTWSENCGLSHSLAIDVCLGILTRLQYHHSLSKRSSASREDAVLFFDKVSTQDNVLPTASIFTTHPGQKRVTGW